MGAPRRTMTKPIGGALGRPGSAGKAPGPSAGPTNSCLAMGAVCSNYSSHQNNRTNPQPTSTSLSRIDDVLMHALPRYLLADPLGIQ